MKNCPKPIKKSSVIENSLLKLPALPEKNVPPSALVAPSFLKYIKSLEHIIIFSPHLDDAILSMGSFLKFLLTLHVKLSVITVFSKGSSLQTPLTSKLVTQGNATSAKDYFQSRLDEDHQAFSLVGDVHREYWNMTDAAWRQTNTGAPLYPTTTLDTRNQADIAKDELVTRMKKIERSPNLVVFAPVGRGRHIDHLFVRDACTEVFPSVIYYGDFPYSNTYTNEIAFIETHALASFSWYGKGYQEKAATILMYRSQWNSFFAGGPLQLPFETFYFSKNIEYKQKVSRRQKREAAAPHLLVR